MRRRQSASSIAKVNATSIDGYFGEGTPCFFIRGTILSDHAIHGEYRTLDFRRPGNHIEIEDFDGYWATVAIATRIGSRPGDNLRARMFLRDSDLKGLGIDCASVLGAGPSPEPFAFNVEALMAKNALNGGRNGAVAEHARAPEPDFDTEAAFDITPAMRAPLYVAPETEVAFAPEPVREPVWTPPPAYVPEPAPERAVEPEPVAYVRPQPAPPEPVPVGAVPAPEPAAASEPSAARKTVASPSFTIPESIDFVKIGASAAAILIPMLLFFLLEFLKAGKAADPGADDDED